MQNNNYSLNFCHHKHSRSSQPALINYDDVKTMFHEFEHALHGLFADQQYPTLSSPNTARDFIEFPSQFNEHLALDPKFFSLRIALQNWDENPASNY